jgi:hypothetical protein
LRLAGSALRYSAFDDLCITGTSRSRLWGCNFRSPRHSVPRLSGMTYAVFPGILENPLHDAGANAEFPADFKHSVTVSPQLQYSCLDRQFAKTAAGFVKPTRTDPSKASTPAPAGAPLPVHGATRAPMIRNRGCRKALRPSSIRRGGVIEADGRRGI